MIGMLKEVGIKPCCGGIIGLGEGPEERLNMAFALRKMNIDCVPINILNPRRGTPLENIIPIEPLDAIRTIAIFRLILPKVIIKVAGGRESGLRDMQAMAFMAGANGMIIGGYLTTAGRPVDKDMEMIKDLGFEL
jgi:biotin synthase